MVSAVFTYKDVSIILSVPKDSYETGAQFISDYRLVSHMKKRIENLFLRECLLTLTGNQDQVEQMVILLAFGGTLTLSADPNVSLIKSIH